MTDPVQRSKFQARELSKILKKSSNQLSLLLTDKSEEDKKIANTFMTKITEKFLQENLNNTITAEVAIDFSYGIAMLLTLLQLPREHFFDGRLVYTQETMQKHIYTRPDSYTTFNRPMTLSEILYADIEPESVSIRRENRLNPTERLNFLILGEDVDIDFFNLMSNTNLHLAGMVYKPTVFDGSTSLPLVFLDHDTRAHKPIKLDSKEEQMFTLFIEEYIKKQQQITLAETKMLSILFFQLTHESGFLTTILVTLSNNNLNTRTIRSALNSAFHLTKSGHHQHTVTRIMDEGFYGNYLKDSLDIKSEEAVVESAKTAIEHLVQITQSALKRYKVEFNNGK